LIALRSRGIQSGLITTLRTPGGDPGADCRDYLPGEFFELTLPFRPENEGIETMRDGEVCQFSHPLIDWSAKNAF
jgi:hypothetical protein